MAEGNVQGNQTLYIVTSKKIQKKGILQPPTELRTRFFGWILVNLSLDDKRLARPPVFITNDILFTFENI